MIQKITPKFFSLRIYLTAITIFILLVFPMSMIMLFKYGPYWLEEQNAQNDNTSLKTEIGTNQLEKTIDSIQKSELFVIQNADNEPIAIETNDKLFQQSISLLFRMFLVSLLLGFAWNYPFQRYFRLKRRGKPIGNQLLTHCRKWLLKIPLVNSLILGFGFITTLTYMFYLMLNTTFTSAFSHRFFEQFFYVATFASFLTVLFVFFWFRHRVRFIYLEHVYDSVSLYKATTTKYRDHIVKRLWINSIMTTLLPLVIVIFYLSLSKTAIKEAGAENLSSEQIEILFGKYIPLIDQTSLFQSENLFYVNAIDSLLMFVGIFSGILISIIYLFFFVNWTHFSIVIPLKEVVDKMKQNGENELDRLAILRTNDELGELANGYNEMAMRISRNINELKTITAANQRFVPIEFLEILGKESITDIVLGDQIQKNMSVLFVDICSFTTLSEQLSPKENFDLLNDYLGTMEPVIRSHNGFIDKFIGDSIMALFGNSVEDAIDAALEMHERLKVFNQLLSQLGRPPIETGAGIHTGNLMLGVVGGEGRFETTVISDSVNLASRLEGLSREYNNFLIVSGTSFNQLKDKSIYHYNFLGEVNVKGRVGAVKIYAITGHAKKAILTK